MGRMLEALRRADGPRPRPGEPPLQPVWPEPEPMAGPADGEDVPFIEVGGPRAATEASPGVLARVVAAPAEVRPTPPPQAPRPAVMEVAFRPLPVGRGPTADPSPVAPELIAFHEPEHVVSGQYRDVTAALLAPLAAARPHVLLFCAATPAAGTTTVLLNVAVTCSRQGGRRVLVVDANLRRPALATRLGLSESPGLREVLAGSLTPEQALRATAQPDLLALTAGHSAQVADLTQAGNGLRSLLHHLRDRFELVLVDGPRWDGRPEVVLLGSACDGVYLVLPEEGAEAAPVPDLLRAAPDQGVCLRGCVLTRR